MPEKQKTSTGKRKPVVYAEPKYRATIGWDPAKITLAKRQADYGSLRLAADLVTDMRGDDRINGVLETLGGVCALPMLFESGTRGLKPEKDVACQALQEGDWWAMMPEQTQFEIVCWLSLLGVAFCCIREWKEDEETGRIVPVLDVWSARWFQWIDESNEWEIETKSGRIRAQAGDGTWVIFGRPNAWRTAPWYGLALFWLLKRSSFVDWADDSDRHAQGKRVVERKDYGADPTGTPNFASLSEHEADSLIQKIHAAGRAATIYIPDGYGLSLLESTAKGAETYQKQIEAANLSFAVTILGQNLTTEVQAGAYASTSIHYKAQGDRIRSVAERVATTVHFQLLPTWSDFNFGATVKTPWAKYDTSPPADKQALAQRFSLVASGIKAMMLDAGIPLDLQKIQEQFELPIDVAEWKRLQKEQEKLRKAQEAAAAAALLTPPDDQDEPEGDDEATPNEAPQDDDADAEDDDTEEAMRVSALAVDRHALALRAQADSDDQLDQGDEYLQSLEQAARVKAVKMLRPSVEELVALVKAAGVEEAETPEQTAAVLKRLRASVVDAYDNMDPTLFSETVDRVEMLASMAGAYSALGEL